MDEDNNIVRLAAQKRDGTSEDSLALAFAAEHATDLRYVALWGHWLSWDSACWKPDTTLATYDRIRALCRETSTKADSARVAGIEKLARADRRLAATVDQWDVDTYLANAPTGVIDLRTGLLRPHRSEDYLTKTLAIGPDPDCPTPLWDAFLKRVTNGDAALVSFLQHASGYALTGDTREHAMFFLYGVGANGKSVLTTTISSILGDYHTSAPIETFVATAQERHPTDLAGLRGARLVSAVETEEGRRWAESKIKILTGGDPIKARFMRQDYFEFLPQFKLWIAGNHKPHLRSVDEAIRRRLHLIPFTVTIPPAERDKHLADKLRAEWPGILHWMIRGCLAWQRQGLAAPPAVRSATENYFANEDAVGTWIDEKCKRQLDGWTTTKELFQCWREWAEAAGERIGTRKGFVQSLEKRPGLQYRHRNVGGTIDGLTIRGGT
jgi:putative DNA primase/helicase